MFGFSINEVATLVSVVAAFLFINIGEEVLNQYYENAYLSLRAQAIAAAVIIIGLRIASLALPAMAIIVIVIDIAIIALRKLMPQIAISAIAVSVAGLIIMIIRTIENGGRGFWLTIIAGVITIIMAIVMAKSLQFPGAEEEDEEEDADKGSDKGITLIGVLTAVLIVVAALVGIAAWVVYSFNS